MAAILVPTEREILYAATAATVDIVNDTAAPHRRRYQDKYC